MEDHHDQKQDKTGTILDLGMDSAPAFNPEMAEFQASNIDIDAFAVPSTISFGAQERNTLSNTTDLEEESNSGCKQFKMMSPAHQQCVYLSVPENTSPLGLILRKTPSFLELVETKLSHSNSCSMPKKRKSAADSDDQQINGKAKASNFSASLLQIGSWKRVSRYDGDLVAKCYFAKRKLVWELLDGGLKNKIEVLWSDITSMKATYNDNAPNTLEIELWKRPRFFRETNPQPRKHTQWKATDDFTGGVASTCRRHLLQFPPGTLHRHYEKLLQSDYGLSLLSEKPYPSFDSPFFDVDSVENPNVNDHKQFGLTGQSLDLQKWMFDSRTCDFSEQNRCFSFSRTMLPQQYENLESIIDACQESSLLSGFTGKNVAHETSILTKDMHPTLVVSLPKSEPEVGVHNLSESNYYPEKRTQDVIANLSDLLLGDDLGMADLHQGNLNTRMNINSMYESKSNCWLTKIQDDQNTVSTSEDIVLTCDTDRFFNEISSFGKLGNNLEEVSGDPVEYRTNISGIATVPVFLDQVAPNEIKEVLEWIPWRNY